MALSLPELSSVLAEDQSNPNDLGNILATPPPIATDNSFSFDSQAALHNAALQAGLAGAGNTVGGSAASTTTPPVTVVDSEWNANMSRFGSGFKPEAYDPTSLKNINDDPGYQVSRVAEDKNLGIFKPIGYDPSSLQHVNDSPATRLVNLFAASPVTPTNETVQANPALSQLTSAPQQRQDMRYQFMPDSQPALAKATVQQKQKKVVYPRT